MHARTHAQTHPWTSGLLELLSQLKKKVPKGRSRIVPKRVCDDGFRYGAVNRQAGEVPPVENQ